MIGTSPLELDRRRGQLAPRPPSPLGVNALLASLALLKGKLVTGPSASSSPSSRSCGAIRLAKPRSPWARVRYTTQAGEA